METLVDQKMPQLLGICRGHGIKYLALCGSAARDGFDPARSDLDFFAIFETPERPGISSAYFGALTELEKLFKRPVDLLTPGSLSNPFLRETVEQDLLILYQSAGGTLMPKHPGKFLHDAIVALASIRKFIEGKTVKDYEGDELVQAAVERKFEIVGEALNQLSRSYPGISSRITGLSQIVGFRNLLIHDYPGIDRQIVWNLARNRGPALEAELEALLKEVSDSTS